MVYRFKNRQDESTAYGDVDSEKLSVVFSMFLLNVNTETGVLVRKLRQLTRLS